ncbi:MAG: response regulator transcription factor [Lachnospiraceae bacterium]|nr:response regulator transcription factor [Lachnospiraceae bacterium]MBR5369555.1 response regulator transcription factor [Lachnospiraceae bacterium]
MNIAIVDDEQSEIDRLTEVLNEYARLNKLDLSVFVFHSAKEVLENYRPYAYTLIFLDIYMPGETGIEAARTILELDRGAMIIFLTTSDAHMPEAFSLHVYDYINKPAGRERLFKVMDDALMRTTKAGSEAVFTFMSNRHTIAVRFSEILLVRTSGRNLEIVDTDGESYETRLSFSEAEKKLGADPRFLTLMKGIIVNMNYITDIRDGLCYMTGGECVAVNVKNSKSLIATWQNYRIGSIRAERRERRQQI